MRSHKDRRSGAGGSLPVVACALVCFVVLYRLSLDRRADRHARERIRDANDLADDLLQDVQGLVLTFHVAAQACPDEFASKHLLDDALLRADDLLSESRKRHELIALR